MISTLQYFNSRITVNDPRYIIPHMCGVNKENCKVQVSKS